MVIEKNESLSGMTDDDITKKIFTFRNHQVMLDRDLAVLYGVKPRRLREQVKRNIDRFPSDFMFQLDDKEVDVMVSHFATPSRKVLGGSLPYVFTEEGVASLASVLTSKRAITVHIQIMRAFVKMRHAIQDNVLLFKRIDKVEKFQAEIYFETNEKFKKVFQALDNKCSTPNQGVFYDGQIFDAYCFASDLIRSAKVSVIVIDNYVDDTVLKLLAKRYEKVAAVIYTNSISKQLKLDLTKHNSQYRPIEIKIVKNFHDRFIILDYKTIYHFGASLKDLGRKLFAFSKMEKDGLKIINKLSG